MSFNIHKLAEKVESLVSTFAQHDPGCSTWNTPEQGAPLRCDCGLDDLKRDIESELKMAKQELTDI